MTDRQRRAVLKAGLGLGAVGLTGGCVSAAVSASSVSVPTIAALRAVAPGAASVVDVAGYNRPHDGGGGQFQWVADHGGADDCGLVIAPAGPSESAGRWLRQAGNVIEFAWFGPVGDSASDDGPPLQRALDCATKSGLPLRLGPGTYHLKSDVNAEVGQGEDLDVRGAGAVFRRSGPSGTLNFDAAPVGVVPIVAPIVPGGDGITLADAGDVAVGDLIAVASGVRLAEARNIAWISAEYGRVAAIRGNRLVLDGPTHSAIDPHRRLAYRMDGETGRLHYRLFWGGDASDVRVALDGRALESGTDFTVSGTVQSGFDIDFVVTPAAGSEVVLSTVNPVHARIFRGGRLNVQGLRFESDFNEAGVLSFVSSAGLAPAGSRFSDLELVERNAPAGDGGYNQGRSGDLFRVGLIDSTVENVRVFGGRYAVQAIAGRNITYRNLHGEGCWHVFSSANVDTVNVYNVSAVDCVSAVDSHFAHIQNVDGVEGVRCAHGMNHRANGGQVRNAVLLDNTSANNPGLNIGVNPGPPSDDRLLADPRENPHVMFSSGNSVVEVAHCRFGAPGDSDGFGIFARYLHRLSLDDVVTDGPLVIDSGGRPLVDQLAVDRFDCRFLKLAGVGETIAARGVTAGQLDLTGCPAQLIRFENCVFDGAIHGGDALILDGAVARGLACRFENCTFRNAARLIAYGDGDPPRHYSFVNCSFDVADRNGF